MIPSNLALPSPSSLAQEVALASQHAGRIVKALESGTGGGWEGIPMLNVFWYEDAAKALALRGSVVSRHLAHSSREMLRTLQRNEVPTLHVAVKQLPKNALVEKQVFYHSNKPTRLVEDADEMTITPTYHSGTLY